MKRRTLLAATAASGFGLDDVAQTDVEPVEPEPVAPAPTTAFAGYGRDEASLDPAFEVEVPEGHGLLVLEPGTAPTTVHVGELMRRLDASPIAIVLPDGIHDLSFVRDDGTSFRFARVTAGHTRYAPAP